MEGAENGQDFGVLVRGMAFRITFIRLFDQTGKLRPEVPI